MSRVVMLVPAFIAVLAFVAPVSAATGISASRWRATLTGEAVKGGATTLITSDGGGTFSVKLSGLAAGSTATATITAAPCGTATGELVSVHLPAASSNGIAAASRPLTVAEATDFRSALSAHHELAVRASQAGAVVACGPEVGAPSVGTGRLTGSVTGVGASYDIRYPVIGGFDPTVTTAIDAVLRHDADGAIRAFQAAATQAGAPPAGSPASTATQTFSVSLSDGRLLSLGTLFSQYRAGAAHGGDSLRPYTFDLATGTRLRLADLFRPGSSYLALLSTESRTRLRALFDAPWLNSFIDPGTTPLASNFGAWQLVPSGLRITFQEYQVAPFAWGMPAIVVPWPSLRSVLNPNSVLSSLAGTGR